MLRIKTESCNESPYRQACREIEFLLSQQIGGVESTDWVSRCPLLTNVVMSIL